MKVGPNNIRELRQEFVSQWGALGSAWGINRTMAQIHALLMIAAKPMHTEMIMDELQSSRGNTNVNLRELINWGLITKVTYPGDRREYFAAEKDVWKIFCIVARERKRREIEPVLNVLDDSIRKAGRPNTEHEKAFIDQIKNLKEFVTTANQLMDKIAKSEGSKLIPNMLKLMK
jgi:DNA-binding transcriptional regulator GbsR (MarR family)